MQKVFLVSVALALALVTGSAWADGAQAQWSQLYLVDASGVPTNSKHVYYFKGVLDVISISSSSGFSFSEGLYSTTTVNLLNRYWVTGKGTWDASRNSAEELLQFQHDGGVDSLNATFKCNGDPWITDQPCVVINVLFNSTVSAGIHDWPGLIKHYRRPLTVQIVTEAKATELSKKHKTASAPPPPPPKHNNPSTIARPTHMGALVPNKTKPILVKPPLHVAKPGSSGLKAKPVPRISVVDLTSGSSLTIGGIRTGWGRTVTVNAAAATTRNRNGSGVCQFRVQHAVRNIGQSSSGAFDSVWRNSAVRGTTGHHWQSLAPGKQIGETDMLMLKPGINRLTLQIDPSHRLKEINRANNQNTLTVNLTGSCSATVAKPSIAHPRSAVHVQLPPVQRLQAPSR